MIVTTHFESLDGNPISEKNNKLLEFWKSSWEKRGFTCIITGRGFIKDNRTSETSEIIDLFIRKINSFPSVNAPNFDKLGFLRWLAAWLLSLKYPNQPICVSECDVMNYSLVPEDLTTLSLNQFHIGDRDGCPAFVYTTSELLLHLVKSITRHTLTAEDNHEGRPHISDQNFIACYFKKEPVYHSVIELIASVFGENWQQYKLVHYGTPSFLKKGMHIHKVDFINRNKSFFKQSMMEIIKSIPDIHMNPLQYVFEHMKLKQKQNTLWLEFGVASGNTINYISNFTNNTVYGFDSYEGLPEKWRDCFDKGSFNMNGIPPPVRNNVELVKGWFQDSLPVFLASHSKSKISFIHMDADLYSSTKCIFDNVIPYLDNDCIIVFDELVNYEGFDGETGELRALYEFIQDNNVTYTWIGMNGKVGMIGGHHEQVAMIIHRVTSKSV